MQQSQTESVKQKSKQQYSRNVKKLKLKLNSIEQEIGKLQSKINSLSNTSNDKIIALKIAKFTKQRHFSPEMIFRFADKKGKGTISKNQLRDTLSQIGLKLTNHQLTRLEYLIDQDISGTITQSEFDSYLSSFGIKKEYSTEDPLIKNALAKLDLTKIKKIAQENQQEIDKINVGKNKKQRNLIDYEQFLKFCHKNLNGLSNKQLAAIFNRLQRNGYVDLEELIQYIKNRQKEDQKLKKKNKENIDKNKGKGIKDLQTATLKGKIKIILQHRQNQSKSLFHSSEFQRVQKLIGARKAQFLILFRRIDKKKRGSFGFNELISDYLQFEGAKDIMFTFQLMGQKIIASNNIPENIVSIYNNNDILMTREQFYEFVTHQFQISKIYVQKLFSQLCKNPTDLNIEVVNLLNAMKALNGQKRIIYIKPVINNFNLEDYLKSNLTTITTNPLTALRNCISIVEQMALQVDQMWDDYQFGPTFSDPGGQSSINMDAQSEKIKWIRTTELGANQFFFSINQFLLQQGRQAIHSLFPNTLISLIEYDDQILWSKQKLQYAKRDLQENDLIPLFSGLYPQVFHQFAKYGIYVFRFFYTERWVYVLIDNKIPCSQDQQILFSTLKGNKHSWISLIQKANAKLHGSYGNLFGIHSIPNLIYQLTRMIPSYHNIRPNLKTVQQKNGIWDLLKIKRENEGVFCAYSQGQKEGIIVYDKIETGLMKNKLIKIVNVLELSDQKCKNDHKSHRLVCFKKQKQQNQSKWNASWSLDGDKNKYDLFESEIQSELKKNNSKISSTQLLITNFKVFREMFNNIFFLKKPNWNNNVILRKRLEFQENIMCKYYLNCTENKLVVTINRIKSPNTACVDISLKINNKILQQWEGKGQFCSITIPLGKDERVLQLGVKNWQGGQQYHYSLTFHFENNNYGLKQRDRHLPFEKVSKYSEEIKFQLSSFGEKQKNYILKRYYKNAERTRICCC